VILSPLGCKGIVALPLNPKGRQHPLPLTPPLWGKGRGEEDDYSFPKSLDSWRRRVRGVLSLLKLGIDLLFFIGPIE